MSITMGEHLVQASSLQTAIEAAIKVQSGRVQKINYQERALWVKRASAPHSAWLYGLQSLLSRALGEGALLAPPHQGGSYTLGLEASRLRALAKLGVNVPEVLAQSEDWLVISDLGAHTLEEAIQSAQPAQRFVLWRQGLDAILQVHQRGSYLSQCFCRNMIVMPDQQIGFIDFEEDPLTVMSLAQAQTRDWALYLHSTAYLLEGMPERHAQFRARVMADHADTQRATAHLMRRVRWLAMLPRHPRWGRDTVRVQAAGQFARDVLRDCT